MVYHLCHKRDKGAIFGEVIERLYAGLYNVSYLENVNELRR